MYNLKCPDCGHDASDHETDKHGCTGCERCECDRTAASLYAEECARLAAMQNELAVSLAYAQACAERDAARAEAQAFLRERNAAVDEVTAARALVARYQAALEWIAEQTAEPRTQAIIRTALDAGRTSDHAR